MARPGRSVLHLVLARGARLAAMGAGLGLVASMFPAHLVEGFLFAVGPQVPATFIGVALTLTAVSLAAASIPARRASRTDPAAVLRSE
jgi:ABC-type antimicrobial peptide transport system permease subunit